MRKVVVQGSFMTNLWGKNRSASELAKEALIGAVKDAGLELNDIKAIIVGNMLGLDFDSDPPDDFDPYLTGQGTVRGQVWLRELGLKDTTILNVEAACAGGSSSLFVGVKLVESGLYPVVALGVEQTRVGNPKFRSSWLENCVPRRDVQGVKKSLSLCQNDSLFMAFNAQWGQELLGKGLATKEDFAITALKARKHALKEPRAKERSAVTLEEILKSRIVIREPLRLLMCAKFCDGASAVVLNQEPSQASKAVIVRACENIAGNGLVDYHVRIKQVFDKALQVAGVEIKDIDVAELHDATSIEELYSTEALGFFEPGQAAEAIRQGYTSVGGKGPVINPSGGLVGRGHPLGATGLCQIVELVEQLRETAQGRQVENAKIAVAVNSGGIIHGDAAVCGVTVLESRSNK